MAERELHYIALAPVEPVYEGQEFEKIPAHMTIIGWFALREAYRDSGLAPFMREVFQMRPWYQHGFGAAREYFGTPEQVEARSIPVTKLTGIETPPWHKLHKFIREEADGTLLPVDSPFNNIFSPHISDTEDYSLPVGESIAFSQVAVFVKDRNDSRKVRTVEDVITITQQEVYDQTTPRY